MASYAAKKLALHICICAALCALVGAVSQQGRLYAGFAAAFLGAAYLLWGWLRFLRASGSAPGARFGRKGPPQAPSFHRAGGSGRQPGGRGRHAFDDSLEDEREERLSALPPQARLRADAIAFCICGGIMLAASLMI